MSTIRKLFFIALVCLIFHSCGNNEEQSTKEKEAILLVTFGSSYEEPKATFKNIEERFKAAYPNKKIYWAYTSRIIRKILGKRGETVKSPAEAILDLRQKGYTHISAQSLHIIPGKEYEEVLDTIKYFNKNYKDTHIHFGEPILYNKKDIELLAEILLEKFSTQLDSGQSVVLMGHGTEHIANNRYQWLQDALSVKTDAMFVGTVEGSGPTIEDVITKLKLKKTEKIILTPLMSVAGDHATNDMAGGYPTIDNGEYAESWNGRLSSLGFDVIITMKGLGDYNEVVDIWLEHFNKEKLKFTKKNSQFQ